MTRKLTHPQRALLVETFLTRIGTRRTTGQNTRGGPRTVEVLIRDGYVSGLEIKSSCGSSRRFRIKITDKGWEMIKPKDEEAG